MKKLQLDLESLRVESFVTREAPTRYGTVQGREIIDTEICNDTNNSACFTYGTACWPACGGGDSQGCPDTKKSACFDCEI